MYPAFPDYANVLCEDEPLDAGCNAEKGAGDTVMIGRCNGPTYTLIHVFEGIAWVRLDYNGVHGFTPMERIRLIKKAA